MDDVVSVQCPYCFEVVEIDLDPETHGRMVQDCEVCCNPWQLTIHRDGEGGVTVDVERAE